MSPPHTPPSPSLRQPLVEDSERRRDSASSLDNRSFQSQEDYLSDLQDDTEKAASSSSSSSLLLPTRKDERGGGDEGQEREERHETSSPLSSSFSLPQAACTASHLSHHQEHLLLSLRSSQERISSPHFSAISSCPYSNPPRLIMKEHNNSNSPPPPPCSLPPSSSSSSSTYGKTPEEVCLLGHSKERGRAKKTAISPLSDTSRDSRFSTRGDRKNEALQGESSSREKTGDLSSSSSSSSFSSPMDELHRMALQSKKSRSQGRFFTSAASASPSPPPSSIFPSCSSPSSSSSIISSARMCLPWSSSSCSSSSSLLYQAYETEKLERKRHIRNGLICAGLDLLLLLPLLATLVQTHRNTPFYSISHSLTDVAVLHFSRALAMIYAFFRLIVGRRRGRWLHNKTRDRSLSILIEEEEEIFAAACQGGDYLSDEEEREDPGEVQRLRDNEKNQREGEDEQECFTGGTSLSDLLMSTKKAEKRERRRRRRNDRRQEEEHLKWGSEDEGRGGARTIRRADLSNGCSPGKQEELPARVVEVCIHQSPETSPNRHDKTASPSSLSSSQRTEEEEGGVREITPSSSSLSPFSSTSSSSSSSTSVSSYPPPSQDFHSGEAKPCSASSPSGGEGEEEVEQAYRVIGLAICLAEEEERQSGRRVETAKHRISISARILGVCFLCSILKAINFRFESALVLDNQLAGSLRTRLPFIFSPSLPGSSPSLSSASSSSDSLFEGSPETRAAAAEAGGDVSVYVEVLLLLLPLIEVIWAVLAPPLEAFFLVRKNTGKQRARQGVYGFLSMAYVDAATAVDEMHEAYTLWPCRCMYTESSSQSTSGAFLLEEFSLTSFERLWMHYRCLLVYLWPPCLYPERVALM